MSTSKTLPSSILTCIHAQKLIHLSYHIIIASSMNNNISRQVDRNTQNNFLVRKTLTRLKKTGTPESPVHL